MISIETLYKALQTFRPLPDAFQREAIEAGKAEGLFIVAGPGSGKTTCLTLRMLKLILVDDVPPRAILATTFTVKAAEELRSRLLGWGFKIIDALQGEATVPSAIKAKLADLDINQVWTGTLDSLCEQLLRDYRAAGTHPPVLVDDFVGRALLLRHGLFEDRRFEHRAFSDWLLSLNGGKTYGFNVGTKATLVQSLWGRRFQDLVDLDAFEADSAGTERSARTVAKAALEGYAGALNDRHMVDFALLEHEVLQRLRNGKLRDFTEDLQVVLVDEYQDTNLLQEQIYFELAGACGGALGVVGDDDQSLYRFRGATVSLFRDFEERFEQRFERLPKPVYLSTNYRSTKRIVEFVNRFAELDHAYQVVRVDGKPRLIPGSTAIDGRPVLGMFRDNVDDLARDLATFIHDVFRGTGASLPGMEMLARSPMQGDVGDAALLCSSPAELGSSGKPRLPKLLRDALLAKAPPIEVFNPRGQDLTTVPIIEIFGGLLAECIDPGGAVQISQAFLVGSGRDTLDRWRQAALNFVEGPDAADGLLEYAKAWALRDPGRRDYVWPRRTSVIELIYGLVHYMPFLHDDPEGQVYLELFTRQLGACEQVSGFKGALLHDPANQELADKSIRDLIQDFLGPIALGAVDIDDDLVGSFPRDRLSVLSIHQSKGLEFPLTIVDVSSDFKTRHPSTAFKRFPEDGGAPHRMEDLMRKYSELREEPRAQVDRAFDDIVRQYFVAFSRPQEVLLLVGLNVGGPVGRIPNVATGWTRDGAPKWADARASNIVMI